MPPTIMNRREATAWQKHYDQFAPKIGDIAPDFELLDVSGKNFVTLSQFRGLKPVALVFGSFTCPPHVQGTVSLRKLYQKYHDKVHFLYIYIREAHPVDGWWLGKGAFKTIIKLSRSKMALNTYDPTTLEERRAVARQCEEALKYGIRTYVDDMDDAVSQAYAAWPTRLYLIGRDGKVVYRGGPGSFDFRPAVLEKEIKKYLAKIKNHL